MHDVHIPGVDVFVVEQDAAGNAAALDRIVHPVQAAQVGRLAAAGGSDQRRDLILIDVETDLLQRLLGTIEHAHFVGLEFRDVAAGHRDVRPLWRQFLHL
jgi:hypothetical protein